MPFLHRTMKIHKVNKTIGERGGARFAPSPVLGGFFSLKVYDILGKITLMFWAKVLPSPSPLINLELKNIPAQSKDFL